MEGKLLYVVVLVSVVQQCELAKNTYISPPSWTSLPQPSPPSRLSPNTRLSSPCDIATSQ